MRSSVQLALARLGDPKPLPAMRFVDVLAIQHSLDTLRMLVDRSIRAHPWPVLPADTRERVRAVADRFPFQTGSNRCMDYAGVGALLLLVIGLALLIAEVFIPSGGVILMMAVACLVGSVWFAWSAWWESYRTYWWAYLASLFVLVPAVLMGAFYIFPRTAWGRRVLLEGPSLSEVSGYAREDEELGRLIGKRGKTLTLLNPGGMVVVDGKRYHAESQGMLLDPGEEIEVIARKGNRVVVRVPRRGLAPVETPPPDSPLETAEQEPFAPEHPGDERRPLDFDFPQS